VAYQHTSRRGDVYWIQARERGGKTVYSAARKPTGNPVDRLPEGYEIYERPENAQVFVRKIQLTRILPIEKQLVEESICRLAQLEHFIVEVETNSLVVYLPDADPDASLSLMRTTVPMTAERARSMKAVMLSRARYEKMMRFTLVEEPSRRFNAERWCFLGGIDDWYFLARDKPLVKLVETYTPHLGRESFFELM